MDHPSIEFIYCTDTVLQREEERITAFTNRLSAAAIEEARAQQQVNQPPARQEQENPRPEPRQRIARPQDE